MSDRFASGSHRLDDVLEWGAPRFTASPCHRAARGPARPSWPSSTSSTTPHRSDRRCICRRCRSRWRRSSATVRPWTSSTSPRWAPASSVDDDLGRTPQRGRAIRGVGPRRHLLRERRPALLVIDSFKALRAYAPDDGAVPPLPARAGRPAVGDAGHGVLGRRVRRRPKRPEPRVRGRDAIVSLECERNAERESASCRS